MAENTIYQPVNQSVISNYSSMKSSSSLLNMEKCIQYEMSNGQSIKICHATYDNPGNNRLDVINDSSSNKLGKFYYNNTSIPKNGFRNQPGNRNPKFHRCRTNERGKVCTSDYNPVCGVSPNGSMQTYGNSCSACGDPNVNFWTNGACSNKQ